MANWLRRFLILDKTSGMIPRGEKNGAYVRLEGLFYDNKQGLRFYKKPAKTRLLRVLESAGLLYEAFALTN